MNNWSTGISYFWINIRAGQRSLKSGAMVKSKDLENPVASVQREAFKKAALLAHNYLRSLHGVKALILSPELCETAQLSAEKIAERGHVIYSDSIAIGENISILPMESRRFFANDVIQHWYDEIVNYDFAKPGWKRGAIRFTQLIWRSSCEMGVGIVRQEDKKKAVVVVHYRPAGNGNMPGEFERNVLPVKQESPKKLSYRSG